MDVTFISRPKVNLCGLVRPQSLPLHCLYFTTPSQWLIGMPQSGWVSRLRLLLLVLFLHNSFAFGSHTAHSFGDSKATSHSNGTSLTRNATGTGYAYAESCQAALRSWSSSSSSYGREHGTRSTSYFSSSMTIRSIILGSTQVTSLITLCDGHPRVVGQISTGSEETSVYATTWTNTNPTFIFASYPTPAPCSINPEDCILLYSSWTSHYHAMTKGPHFGGLLDPPCTTKTSSYSYSTNSNGEVCNNCQVIGSKIRLLYWPVTTKAGSGNLCSMAAETLTAKPSGNGPNTFVTQDITITSPTVAVSIGGLSRVDQCGTTVQDTIIPVLPADVSSVEGARALFTHRPFNFANLNYRCMSNPGAIYITTSGRDDCYQEVPASAYFYGYANAAGADWWSPEAFANSTIWNNYQPQVLPPNTLTAAIQSLWGSDCNIHPDGVWDPPIALGHETSFPLPKDGLGSPTQYFTPTSNPAMPALPTYAQASSTAVPEQPEHEGPGTLSSVAAPSLVANGHKSVHAVHTTILTLPAKHGVEVFTAIYGADGTSLVNEETTIRLGEVSATSALPPASFDPTQGSTTPERLVTVNGAEYTVDTMKNSGFELIDQSTTARVYPDKTQRSRTVGHLALGTGASSPSHNDEAVGTSSLSAKGSSSASGAGMRTALTTCVYLSQLAISMALFM